MKKLPRLKRRKTSSESEASNRITNETVAEHREQILAGGKRFKYPMQYSRHRLVIVTLIISVIAVIAITVITWWQLYPMQNSSTFFYRVTRVVPLPVASVDGWQVPYSDYLSVFRSQEHYVQTKEGTSLYSKENKQRLDLTKRKSLDEVITDSYASKLAKEMGVDISKERVDEAIKRQRESRDGVASQEAYDAIVLDQFNWTPAEAREATARKLLRQEVAYKIDKDAVIQRDQVLEKLKVENDFNKLALMIKPIGEARVQASVTPLVPNTNQDGGQAEMASKLKIGQVSKPFRSTTGDGYYIVKLLQKDNNSRISYASLKIPLTTFNKWLSKIKNDHKIHEYISVPEVKDPTSV
ncbi:MAG: SurA N-terminal domain-containing protein [Candidatus Saccharimonadales bacterium]